MKNIVKNLNSGFVQLASKLVINSISSIKSHTFFLALKLYCKYSVFLTKKVSIGRFQK